MMHIVGSVTARPGMGSSFFHLAREHATRTRKEPGCIFFHVEQVVDDPNLLIVAECYVDAAAHASHDASSYMQDFMKVIDSHLATLRFNMIVGGEIEVIDKKMG
jgi:quinol monooxygenase YgiN